MERRRGVPGGWPCLLAALGALLAAGRAAAPRARFSPFFFLCTHHGELEGDGEQGEVLIALHIAGNPSAYVPGQEYHENKNMFEFEVKEGKKENNWNGSPATRLLSIVPSGVLVFPGKHPQDIFHWAAFQPLCPKTVGLHGVVVTDVQDLALGLVELLTIDPSIQLVQIPLQTLPTFQEINSPAQFGVICKLAEGALDLLVQFIDKDI
ncbi:hypothetical protein WISP_128424 [Willisornis vidua]|uniref:Uncharacterized protein n=1 Tax=Willisornis vidua TaxID=1566151 RepID=A0ABQ9CQD1_9PASS|nr:hypothetical protein WISP_128424 [Willisornis vidua]